MELDLRGDLMIKTKLKVDVESESLTKKQEDFIERVMMDIGFVLIKYAEKYKLSISKIK